MEKSGFFLEGPTIFVGSYQLNGIVQVYPLGFRIINEGTILSKIGESNISEQSFDSGILAKKAVICGCFLSIIFQDGNLSVFDLSKSLSTPLLVEKNIISISAFMNTSDSPHICIISFQGTLKIIALSSLSTIFENGFYSIAPKILHNSNEVSLEPEFCISEVFYCIFGRKEYLILRSDLREVFVYERYQFLDAVKYQKISLNIVTRESLSESDSFKTISQVDRQTMFSFDNLSGLKGLFFSGKRPFWLLYDERRQYLWLHKMFYKVEAHSFAAFSNADCLNGFIYLDGRGLQICQLDNSFQYTNDWPYRKIPLKDRSAEKIAFHVGSDTFVIATSKTVPFNLAPEDPKEEYTPTDSKLLPRTKSFELELISPVSWEVIDKFTLLENEHVLNIKCEKLDSKRSQGGVAPFIIVGTAFVKGEDRQARGRVLIFDVIEVVPDPNNPQSNHKLKLLFADDLKGPVASVGSIYGRLVTSTGTKVMIHEFEDCESLNGVAFADVQIFAHTMCTLKNYVYYGDIYKGSAFLAFSQEPTRLVQLSKDYQEMSVLAVEFLIDRDKLYLVACDNFGSFHIFSYSPHNLLTMAGQKLLKRADYYLGQRVAKIASVHSRTRQDYFFDVYGTSQGSVGFLSSISEKTYRRLSALYQKMVHLLPQKAGLNPKAFRQQAHDEHRRLGTSARSILDGDFLLQFMELSKVHQRELSKGIGSSIDKIYEDFAEIEDLMQFGI